MLKFSLAKQIRKTYQPKRDEVGAYIKKSLLQKFNSIHVNIAIVSTKVSQELNLQYRGKDKPTNVISLEYADSRTKFNLLHGELILCDEVIVTEALAQNKSIAAHYAHMIIHGMLHLQGLDHIKEHDAQHMEQLEIKLLKDIGFKNPYN